MANKVTPKDIALFNKLYYEDRVYAHVAKATGFSASTVKKYINPNWKPVDESKVKRFHIKDLPEFTTERFKNVDSFGQLCTYSTEEKYEVEQLWLELSE